MLCLECVEGLLMFLELGDFRHSFFKSILHVDDPYFFQTDHQESFDLILPFHLESSLDSWEALFKNLELR